MVHLLRIIFNFLFCLIPISYSTEIFAKFFHLPPPICIQLPCSQTGFSFFSPLLLSRVQNIPTCTLKQMLCVFYYLLDSMSHSSSIACAEILGGQSDFDVFWLW